MLERRSLLQAAAAFGAAAVLPACHTVQENASTELPAPGTGKVMLVGRIEVVPRISPREQNVAVQNDIFNTKRHFMGRAVIRLADRRDPGDFHQLGALFLNPNLEETFFYSVPRTERFVADASIAMEWQDLTPASKNLTLQKVELKLPVPLELDIQPADQALYLGTVRMHRDVYHTLLRVEVLDQQSQAQEEFSRRFGPQARMRKALLKVPGAVTPAVPRPRAA
ncbi:hypothetical protein [Ramlibacter tataouinensis]|uniref:Uncharacterized protein n=1 Tax=Ramlibacter tataouinensis (strain ATCC BAA-407 / DSM 14655 / LMG 21543 / TTB310) TaxID=365046 RepID=F5XXG9_RAMTT|nr:hypothetical protein [Ramlibacter tataouinensis]AEG94304.1 hypothetical protein Rta_31930 [Ramlibacter tataouinensis TTB310]